MPFPPHRRYKMRFHEPARLHAPDGAVIRLLRDWLALGEDEPLVPTIFDLRKRTREVLGE